MTSYFGSHDMSHDQCQNEAECEKTTNQKGPVKADLLDIIALQKFSGNWELSEELCRIFGKTSSELLTASPLKVISLSYIDETNQIKLSSMKEKLLHA